MIGAMLVRWKADSGFRHLNNRDISSFINSWKTDAVFVYPGNVSVSGEYHGIESITQFWEKFFNQFPEAHFTCNNVFVNNCYALGLSNEITLDWDVAVTNRDGKEFFNSGISVVKLKNGKIVHFKDYFFSPQVMTEAWGEN